mmetsp:Transcript_50626/g.134831  ORF Transcript_50626/g.134831 Transcript_50626/m.134831 type:complete len:293 (+) Transcript_50626:602-1480(+)
MFQHASHAQGVVRIKGLLDIDEGNWVHAQWKWLHLEQQRLQVTRGPPEKFRDPGRFQDEPRKGKAPLLAQIHEQAWRAEETMRRHWMRQQRLTVHGARELKLGCGQLSTMPWQLALKVCKHDHTSCLAAQNKGVHQTKQAVKFLSTWSAQRVHELSFGNHDEWAAQRTLKHKVLDALLTGASFARDLKELVEAQWEDRVICSSLDFGKQAAPLFGHDDISRYSTVAALRVFHGEANLVAHAEIVDRTETRSVHPYVLTTTLWNHKTEAPLHDPSLHRACANMVWHWKRSGSP